MRGNCCFSLGLSFLLIKWEFGAVDPVAVLGVLELVPAGLRVDTLQPHDAQGTGVSPVQMRVWNLELMGVRLI